MSDAPGTWVMGCICPSETRVRNLRIFEWHDPKDDEAVAACKQIDIHGTMDGLYVGSLSGEYRKRLRASVSDELGWCGCGDGDRVDELMLTYLSWMETYWDWSHAQTEKYGYGPGKVDYTQAPQSDLNADANILLAYITDKLGWTEHGGSVFGAWLTDDGKEALANLQRPEYE